MLEHPDIRKMQIYGSVDEGRQRLAGQCEMCGADLYKEDGLYYADDYIETEHGLICWDCWNDYGKKLMREQRRYN